MKALQNPLFNAAMASSVAFDPILRKLNSKRLTLADLVASEEVPGCEKLRIVKGLARNMFKAYLVEPEPLLVEDGLADSQEVRTEQLVASMEVLQNLYADAYLMANGTPVPAPLGYFAIRSGDQWIEISRLDSALNPKIQELKNRVEDCAYFD
jgi:hypothetical protein